jgi:predicted Holliday junction resolvase-like endonuclease
MFWEVLVAILVGIVIYLFIKNFIWKIKFEQRVKESIENQEKFIRQDAVLRGARTLSGKTLEKLIPFLRNFKHDPHDIRWIGDPVDLVIFDGYSANGRKNIEKITFVEVKSGNSELNSGQKRIREIIEKKKINWEEFRI